MFQHKDIGVLVDGVELIGVFIDVMRQRPVGGDKYQLIGIQRTQLPEGRADPVGLDRAVFVAAEFIDGDGIVAAGQQAAQLVVKGRPPFRQELLLSGIFAVDDMEGINPAASPQFLNKSGIRTDSFDYIERRDDFPEPIIQIRVLRLGRRAALVSKMRRTAVAVHAQKRVGNREFGGLSA
ncbi:MAG: hypothetical protein BWY71_01964 [Planctomycetes bacterium ADurb.Bin412]|nr:MAG: hypothetical protein BWY71_01964 [Planctomycetes bacterium ADurb.Bin412]